MSGQQQPYAPPEPRNTAAWLIGGIALFSVIGLLAALLSHHHGKTAADIAQDQADYREAMAVHLTITLTGSATSAEVTMQVGQQGSKQFLADVPMMNRSGGAGLEYDAQAGDFVYFSAQNQGDYGDLDCAITRDDGTVVQESSSSVAYGIVTCTGTA